MTGWGRAFYGAAFGSVLTLLIHPASRPVMLAYWYQPSSLVERASNAYTYQGSAVLPAPKRLEDASLWVQMGADRTRRAARPDTGELKSLLRVVDAAALAEPENAFWKQMSAVYLRDSGKYAQARAMWIAASKCRSWNDYQSSRLVLIRRLLETQSGIRMSWQAALAFCQRSIEPALEIATFSRWVLTGVKAEKPADLELRMATLNNAALLVEGSRSIAVGQIGTQIFDIGCGIQVAAQTSRRDRYKARYALKSQFQKVMGSDMADASEKLLRSNEAWSVLTSTDPAIENPPEVIGYSALTGSLPGTFMILGMIGLAIYGVGWTARFWPANAGLRTAVLSVAAVILGIGAYLAVDLPLLGILVALSVVFQSLTPTLGDRRQLKRLGSLFEFAVTVFAITIIAVLGMLFFGSTAAGASALAFFGVPPEYLFGSTILTGIGIIIFCLMLVVPPTWAITHRVNTAQVVRLMFQRLGSILAAVCLALAIILTPTMLLMDRGLSEKMDKLLENEPLYYVHP